VRTAVGAQTGVGVGGGGGGLHALESASRGAGHDSIIASVHCWLCCLVQGHAGRPTHAHRRLGCGAQFRQPHHQLSRMQTACSPKRACSRSAHASHCIHSALKPHWEGVARPFLLAWCRVSPGSHSRLRQDRRQQASCSSPAHNVRTKKHRTRPAPPPNPQPGMDSGSRRRSRRLKKAQAHHGAGHGARWR
jgi:hypothetical protein